MGNLPELPGLEGLFGLARREGVDIRAVLFRVLTDLYVQTPAHSALEERQYTEQTLRLLGSADVPTRVALAKRLADYPQIPRAVLARLARDVVEVAEPILKHSSSLASSDLNEIVRECGRAHAEVIARRGETTASGEAAAAAARELCELFYAADGRERYLILMSLDYSSAPPADLAAPRLVAILRDSDPVSSKAPRPDRLRRYQDADGVRRGLSEISERHAPSRDPLIALRSARARRGD